MTLGSPTPRYRVYIRDGDYDLVDELSDWLNLTAVIRFNRTGTWALDVSTQSVSAPLLDRAAGIVVTRRNETTGDDEVIFSGSVATELRRTLTTLSLAGVDDNVFLEEPARPTPANAEGPYPDDYDVRTGVASTVMLAYVDANIGPSAPAVDAEGNPVRIAALALAADPLLGGTVTGRANFQSLQALLGGLAATPAAGGLGFRILQSDTVQGQLDVTVWAPADRTDTATFSVPGGTAQDYEDTIQWPEANYWVVLGGDGFGANRTVIEGGDAAAIAAAGRRITGVYDARGITDTSELEQKLAELLAGTVTTRRTTIVSFAVPSLEFGTDWDFGDLVSVVVNGEVIEEVIREVQIELTRDRGAVITPMIGEAGATDDELAAQQTKAIRERLTNVELNWRVPNESITNAMMTTSERWNPGDLRLTARASAAPGWVLLQGQSVLRSAYPNLYALWGTTYGAVDGSHFTLPDARDRFPVGAGSSYTLGTTGGGTANLSHTHPHSHGGGTLAWAHTHPGSHSHGIGSHTHTIAHTHTTNIDHDHAEFDSGGIDSDTVAVGQATPGGGTYSHHHKVNVPALGTTNVTSSASSAANSGSGSGSTDSDNNVFAASGVSWSGGTDPDSTAGGSTTQAIVPKYLAVNWEAYEGA